MSEIRYIETYEKGELLSREPYEVSDEQLGEENEERFWRELDVSSLDPVLGKLIIRLRQKRII